MKKILFALILIASFAQAQVNQSNCNTCTFGYSIVLQGDTQVIGTLKTASAVTTSGGVINLVTPVTGAVTLTQTNCGGIMAVTAAADTTSITLPAVSAVGLGCEYTFSYVGANAGCLMDISPNAADGIIGGVTLAASVVTFSGTADADVGLTKASGLKGDYIRLTSCLANTWCTTGAQGIFANN